MHPTLIVLCGTAALVVLIIALIDLSENGTNSTLSRLTRWLTAPFVHHHEGPVYKVTLYWTNSTVISGDSPQMVNAWHTCKTDGATYLVERYETVDEFEARHKPAAPTE